MRTVPAAAQALLATSLISAAPMAASAQDGEPVDLGTLVLSAAGVATDPLTAPASVTVVSGDDLRAEGFTDLTEAVDGAPGVFVDNNDNITFRGLRPEDTLILIDGQRVNTRQSRTNGSGGLDQFYVPPASAIDRVEIVRGTMSSLYGSEALGGVVNIITKPVADEWTGSMSIEFRSPTDKTEVETRQTSFFLSGPVAGDRLGLQVWGRRLERAQEDGTETDDRELEDINVKLSYVLSPDHEVFLQYGNTSTINEAEGLRGSAPFELRREDDRDTLSLGYEGYAAGWDITALLAREDATRETPTSSVDRTIEFSTTTFDIKGSREFQWNGLHQLTIGGQYMKADLTDLNLGSANTTRRFNFSNTQTSLFAEDIWQASDRLSLTFGARYTEDERFGGKLTPRVYAVYELSDGLYLNGGIATGYKTPELRDANENYFLPTGGRRSGDAIRGNPDLKPEETTTYEMGLRFDNGRTRATATLFQIDFENKIDTARIATGAAPQGGDLYEYINVDKVRNRGLELTAGQLLTDGLEISGTYTFVDSEQLSGVFAGQPLNRTPEQQASLRLDWQTGLGALSVWGQANYVSESSSAAQDRNGDLIVTDYDSYTTLDIGATYTITENVALRGAVYNVIDSNVTADDHGTTQNGRSLMVGLTTQF